VTDTFDQAALDYHRQLPAGKLKIVATKPLSTQDDLAMAYSPGVAAACRAIEEDPKEAAFLTARSNMVAIITNGTAVLGLGNIGPLASKPVMEGKAVLFKKFAAIDGIDVEVDELDPKKLVDIIASLEPTYGGINLEDIKAPECFYVEEELKKRMNIPVFHDDQHGTAIIVGAACINALKLVKKDIGKVKLVCSGAGAAALACLDVLVGLGLKKENVIVCDQKGVIYKGRKERMDPYKERYATDHSERDLNEAMHKADIFLGLSAAGVLKPQMIKAMADDPIIFALANPTPEIMPEEARKVRKDVIIATGRSDYHNQVNNVLCFPYIFRGALDVGATCINEEMKLACVHALADLAMQEASDVVASVYPDEELIFGPEYLIPKPFDPRLVMVLAPAVAKAAMDTGVATLPIEDLEGYANHLASSVYRSGMAMRPIFTKAKSKPMRVAYADGEDERVLRAVQHVLDENLAQPIVIGRRNVLDMRIKKLKLRMQMDEDFLVIDPENDKRYNTYWTAYHKIMERKGVTPDLAKMILRTNTTVIANLMIYLGEADAAISGLVGRYPDHLKDVVDVHGLLPGLTVPGAMSVMVTDRGTFFFCDPYVNQDPTAEQLAEMTVMAADQVRRFGLVPKVALLSHSFFGSSDSPGAVKMRKTLKLIQMTAPELEVEGEMHADHALNEEVRYKVFPDSKLVGSANLLIMPNLDTANISFNLLKVLADGQPIGPVLLGPARAAHILTPSSTTRGIINMTALAVVDAQNHELGRDVRSDGPIEQVDKLHV
jgi:malate dehydrogenase (oxaloacetate-decarboxylating)(NADP+)